MKRLHYSRTTEPILGNLLVDVRDRPRIHNVEDCGLFHVFRKLCGRAGLTGWDGVVGQGSPAILRCSFNIGVESLAIESGQRLRPIDDDRGASTRPETIAW